MPPQNIIEQVMREFEETVLHENYCHFVNSNKNHPCNCIVTSSKRKLLIAITTVLLEARKLIGEGKDPTILGGILGPQDYQRGFTMGRHQGFNSAISRSQEVIDALIGKK
jgi:hypothetical protein